MPMLLEAVPSFSGQWSEIEDDPIHLDEETGARLIHRNGQRANHREGRPARIEQARRHSLFRT